MRIFNTTGPVNPADHYCLSPLHRFDLEEIELLIAQKRYVMLHAPTQVGKTSYLLALKIQHKSLEKTLELGLEQTWQYMDTCGTRDGHLIIFNRHPDVAWSDKIFRQSKSYQCHPITVCGM